MTHLRTALALLAIISFGGCRGGPSPADDKLVGRPAAAEAAQRANLWYRVALADDHLDVAVRLFAPPMTTKFFLPGEWAGRNDFADVIGITGASTSDGPTDVAINRADGTVSIDRSEQANWAQLQYRVEFSDRSPFHAQRDAGVVIAFGPTFLATPAQQVLERTSQIPIELNVPAGYDVVSTWPGHAVAPSKIDTSRAVHQFVAANVGELRDAFVATGRTLRTVRTGSDDDVVEVGFSPAFEGDTAEFAELVTSVTHRFRRRYGSAGPVHVFVRTRRSTPGEFGGVGRRGGFILDVAPDTAVSSATRLLVAHEALHVWNGHLVIPTESVESSTRWFKEGVTHYLALKSMPQLGEKFVLAELAKIAANYTVNPLAHGAEGKAIDRARLPYDFGVLVALGLDATLTRTSSGKRDISCWLGALVDSKTRRYDEQSLLEALQQCAGSAGSREVARRWRRWVRVREPIDLRVLFGDVGLHWLPQTEQRSAKLVPLDDREPLYRQLFELEAP